MPMDAGPAELFPLVVGVSGHCDLLSQTSGAVKDAVRLVLRAMVDQFGADAVCVLSALAGGADQLVAGVADELKLRVIAVAPMPLDDYRAVLQPDADAAARFEAYWQHAELQLVLPWVAGNEIQRDHKLQYEQLAGVVTRYSHLLLALWDGGQAWHTLTPEQRQAARGGTSHVLYLRANAEREAEGFRRSPLFRDADSRLDLARGGPVLHVVTPREHSGGAVAGPAGLVVRAGDCIEPGGPGRQPKKLDAAAMQKLSHTFGPAGAADFLPILELNQAIRAFGHYDHALHDLHVGYLRPRHGDLDREGAAWLHVLCRFQAGADVAAQAFQRRLLGDWPPAANVAEIVCNLWRAACRRGWRHPHRPMLGALAVFTLLGPLAVGLFGAYAHVLTGEPRMAALALYLAVLFGGVAFYVGRVRRGRWQDRFQDYRALAEAMRVQVFWALAAAPRAVSDHYLRLQRDELGWIQFALRGPALWAAALALHLNRPERAHINECWLDSQRDYFLGSDGRPGKAAQHRRAHQEMAATSQQWFLLGALLSVALLLIEVIAWTDAGVKNMPDLDIPRDLLLFLIPTVMTIAAAFALYTRLHGFEAQAQSYRTMGQLFMHARGQVDATDDAEYGRLIFDLGREALAENAAWLLDHRRRPIEHEMH